MTSSLRYRIVLTLLPLLALMAILGAAAMVLLHHLGGRTDAILRENYRSVIYMERLNEALERIDSSFQFALAGKDQEEKARQQYAKNWRVFRKWQQDEANNITEPGEDKLVARLALLAYRYRLQGEAFYARPPMSPGRLRDYFDENGLLELGGAAGGAGVGVVLPDYLGSAGLLGTFRELKEVTGDIRRLNQNSMEQASREARETARASLIGFGGALAVAALLAVWLAWRTARTILQPIKAVTESALAIGAGNLNQVMPVMSGDELGQLANAFNTMARQLRAYRQSHRAQFLRVQQASQATIDSFPDPVLVLDPEGRVDLANPIARSLLGIAEGSQGARGVAPWTPPELLRQPLVETLQEQRPYIPESFDQAVVLRDAGKERFFLPRLLPIRDPHGATLGAAVLLQDVTRFRLLDEVKSNLVATVSHELKTPLTSIRLVVHLLLEETVGPLSPKQLELLLDARENAERLLAMINNLLDLARLEVGRKHLAVEPVPPADLLKEAADSVRPRAENEGVELVLEVPPDLPPVGVDTRQLGHALHNLLDNALTYTKKGGRISMSAEAADGQVVLSVADTGAGIPEEFLPHVFEKFFRVPGKSQRGGTGLGLAIVREIVTAHGGTVSCESRAGEGTVFRLTLPAWADDKVIGMV